jgi:hypothetical protein
MLEKDKFVLRYKEKCLGHTIRKLCSRYSNLSRSVAHLVKAAKKEATERLNTAQLENLAPTEAANLIDRIRSHSKQQMKKVAGEENSDADANDVVVAFDSMIIRSQMLLSSKKGSQNKLIGVNMTKHTTVIELDFNRFVKNICDADEDTEGTFEENLADALVLNREHMVYYAKSLKPGCPLCFLCATYNLPSVKLHAVEEEAFEVILHLEEFGFIIWVLTSNAAASNTAFFSLSLCRVGQDVNEHHFGNARGSVRSHLNPNQREAMAAILTMSLV